MADNDWDTVTRIGSKARAGGGATDRERVIKGKSALNAAQRAGVPLLTEKKYGSSNTRPNIDGQRNAKLARENDVVPPLKVSREVAQAIIRRRSEMEPKLTQRDLATKINEPLAAIQELEKGEAQPNQALLGKIERHLGIKLRGSNIGQPLGAPKSKK